jgi:positive regulator of sigma E activity
MLSEPAVVTASQDGRLHLQADRSRACAKCNLKRGCGQYLLGSDHAVTLNLPSAAYAELQPGTEVRLAIPERGLLQLVAGFYLLPLFLLLGAVTLGWMLGLSEALQLFCAVLGLGLGLAASRVLLRGVEPSLQILPAADAITAACVSSGVSLS